MPVHEHDHMSICFEPSETRAFSNDELSFSALSTSPYSLQKSVLRLLMTVDVNESPLKKAQLGWIQATSAESFEASLFAGGYAGYGSTPTTSIPSIPSIHSESHKDSKDQLQFRVSTPSSYSSSSKTLSATGSWSSQSSSETARSTSSAGTGSQTVTDEGTVVDERNCRMKRRLDAFRRRPSQYHTDPGLRRRLLPVQVEGRGRILLEAGAAGLADLLLDDQDASSKRKGRRRKLDSTIEVEDMGTPSGSKMSRRGGKDGAPTAGAMPNWPDAEFPWVLKVKERVEREEKEEREKLRRIERFLESDSEDEEEEEELDGELDLNLVLSVAKW